MKLKKEIESLLQTYDHKYLVYCLISRPSTAWYRFKVFFKNNLLRGQCLPSLITEVIRMVDNLPGKERKKAFSENKGLTEKYLLPIFLPSIPGFTAPLGIPHL